jgi:hypothetical protein
MFFDVMMILCACVVKGFAPSHAGRGRGLTSVKRGAFFYYVFQSNTWTASLDGLMPGLAPLDVGDERVD